MIIKNAVIESVSIDDGERGLLTAWLNLNYGGTAQGFGGYALYLPNSYSHHKMLSHAGHFIYRCMRIGDVSNWTDLKGKAIRVKIDSEGGKIIAIGHIINEDWFNPSEDFKTE